METKILSIFLQFETQFDPYTTYCMEEANCLKYFKEKLTESEDFKMYITVRSLRAVMLHCGSFQSVVPLFLSGIVKKNAELYRLAEGEHNTDQND